MKSECTLYTDQFNRFFRSSEQQIPLNLVGYTQTSGVVRFGCYWQPSFSKTNINHLSSHYFQSNSFPCAQSMITIFVPVKYHSINICYVINHNSSKMRDQSSIMGSASQQQYLATMHNALNATQPRCKIQNQYNEGYDQK